MNANIEQDLKTYLKENLSQKRFEHTLGVYDTAIKLAKLYNEDENKVKIAALAHDIAKERSKQEQEIILNTYFPQEKDLLKVVNAWHSYTGTIISQELFNIKDPQILNAIKYHTLGHINMDNIAKIIYIADFIEPGRSLLNLKYYQDLIFIKKKSLDEVFNIIFKDNITYLQSKNFFIPKQSLDLLNKIS